MTNIKALGDLIAAVERGEPNKNDGTLYLLFGDDWVHAWDVIGRGSLDAAKSLHEALLPGWFPGMSQNIHHGHWYVWVQDKAMLKDFSAEDNSPARAWLIAILKAYRAQMEA